MLSFLLSLKAFVASTAGFKCHSGPGHIVIRQLSKAAFLKVAQPGLEEHSFTFAFLHCQALAFILCFQVEPVSCVRVTW